MAALTIVRAYFADREWTTLRALFGKPVEAPADPLGSYVDWGRWVRDALLWLGQADRVAAIDTSKSLDPGAEGIGGVFRHWAEVIGDGGRSTGTGPIGGAASACRGP